MSSMYSKRYTNTYNEEHAIRFHPPFCPMQHCTYTYTWSACSCRHLIIASIVRTMWMKKMYNDKLSLLHKQFILFSLLLWISERNGGKQKERENTNLGWYSFPTKHYSVYFFMICFPFLNACFYLVAFIWRDSNSVFFLNSCDISVDRLKRLRLL